jgi:molybdopterin-guanine dinucleotide biosynthesis protein A
MKAAAIILSGGKSSRMGTNKALLKINEKTNIERIVDRLKPLFDEMILVTNNPKQYEFLELKTVTDHFPGMGPLAGVHAGLEASSYETNFIVACDMPFVSGELARALVDKSSGFDAVIPVIFGKQHPLFAVFQKRLVPTVEQCLKEERLKVKDLLDQLHVRNVSENDLTEFDLARVFFNMNHPNEYEDALMWAKNEQEGK